MAVQDIVQPSHIWKPSLGNSQPVDESPNEQNEEAGDVIIKREMEPMGHQFRIHCYKTQQQAQRAQHTKQLNTIRHRQFVGDIDEQQ